MTPLHGNRGPGHRRGLPAHPSVIAAAAESWIDARLSLFSMRCRVIDNGLRRLSGALAVKPEIAQLLARLHPGTAAPAPSGRSTRG